MTLTQAIDALLAFVDEHYRTPDYGDRLPEFDTLDKEVYVEACRAGLQDSMPRRDATFNSHQIVYFGRTNVPGCWSSPADAPSTLVLMATPGWKADMEILLALAEGKTGAPRTGRPRKGEMDKDHLVIGALVEHHGYQQGGSVINYNPAKTARLAQLASEGNVTVSKATVSRFFTTKFPGQKKNLPGRGYKGYENACTAEKIGLLLAIWQGDLGEHLADLEPEEYGRREDDE